MSTQRRWISLFLDSPIPLIWQDVDIILFRHTNFFWVSDPVFSLQ
jgi:hypothetical protein